MDNKKDCEKTKDVAEQYEEQNENDTSDFSFLDQSGGFDLTLIVEARRINLCRAVLCIASPVFQRMLNANFKEKDQEEIDLPGKNYEDFVEFLCCLYPDKLTILTGENVYRVLPLVKEYQVKILEDRCQKLLLKTVNDKYIADGTELYRHLQLAELYSLEELKSGCIHLASGLSLAEMDKGSSACSVSDRLDFQIRYLALQRKERIIELDQGDDMFLLQNACTWVEKDLSAIYCRDIIKIAVDKLSRSFKCSELLRAARLNIRFFKSDREMLLRIIDGLNAKKHEELTQFKNELDLLPAEIKKSLTMK